MGCPEPAISAAIFHNIPALTVAITSSVLSVAVGRPTPFVIGRSRPMRTEGCLLGRRRRQRMFVCVEFFVGEVLKWLVEFFAVSKRCHG